MAIKRKTSLARAERRVSLSRGGEAASTAKNTRRTIKQPRQKGVWFKRFERSFSFAAVSFIWVLGVAVLSVGLLYSYRFLTTSQYFTLKYVEIQGNSRLSSREILDNAALSDGANALALSINEVEDRLARNPWVKDVSVKRILPERLVIGVNEREPAFLVLLQNGMYYADELGSVIAPVTPGQFTPLPTLDVEQGAQTATTHLPDLIRHLEEAQLPLGGRVVSFVRLSASRGVEIFVEDSRLKLSLGLEEWLDNLHRLGKTLADLERRKELRAVREIKAYGANVWVEKNTQSGS